MIQMGERSPNHTDNKGKQMKHLLLIIISTLFSINVIAEDLTLEKRQPDTVMNMTSLTLGDDESVINAEGDMGVYGRV